MQLSSFGQVQLIQSLQSDAFQYFIHEIDSNTGLVKDSTKKDWPSSIAAVGMALSAYPVGIERGFITRDEAIVRTLRILRFFSSSEQSRSPTATGYKGFYYHFLDMETGERAWQCELSTIDSALLFAGMLLAAQYFDRDSANENEIRELAIEIYGRADWRWALNDGPTLTHGWRPESGFLDYRWDGYDEALIAYVIGLGSPTSRFLQRVLMHTRRSTSGRKFTTTNTSSPRHCSRISSHTCGSIFVAFRIAACAIAV